VLAAAASTFNIYTSTDGGATWVERTSSGTRSWVSVALSSDGTKLVAGVSSGYIYTSTDGGATWVARTSAGSGAWRSIAIGSTGEHIVAVRFNDGVWTSANSGLTWFKQQGTQAQSWISAGMAYTGDKAIVSSTSGEVYVLTNTGRTNYTSVETEMLRDSAGYVSVTATPKIAGNTVVVELTGTLTMQHPVSDDSAVGAVVLCVSENNDTAAKAVAACRNKIIAIAAGKVYVGKIFIRHVYTASTTLPVTFWFHVGIVQSNANQMNVHVNGASTLTTVSYGNLVTGAITVEEYT
jgi:hypothetical protein